MALPTSGAISFSDLQTFYGGSNPISLSEYNKGGSYVPNPSSYNSGTQTTAAGNANSSVVTGSTSAQSLSNYYSGMKLSAPTISNVTVNSQSGDTGVRGWVGQRDGSPWYESGYQINYSTNGSTANYGQMMYVVRWGLAGQTASWSMTFRTDVAGEYYAAFIVQGNGGASGTYTITGDGVTSGGSSGTAYSFNTLATATPVFAAGTDITITNASGTAGGGGDAVQMMLRTNCNADSFTMGSGAGNNYMLTKG